MAYTKRWNTIEWSGPKGKQVPVFVTDTTNRLFKIVPLSMEGGACLSEVTTLLAAAPALLEALQGLFAHCVMIHSQWGEHSNQNEADAAIANAKAAIAAATKEV